MAWLTFTAFVPAPADANGVWPPYCLVVPNWKLKLVGVPCGFTLPCSTAEADVTFEALPVSASGADVGAAAPRTAAAPLSTPAVATVASTQPSRLVVDPFLMADDYPRTEGDSRGSTFSRPRGRYPSSYSPGDRHRTR